MAQIRHIVGGIVAAAGQAGHLIRGERIHDGGVDLVLFKTTSAEMTMQTLGILESARDRNRVPWRAHVLHVNSRQASELILQWAVDAIVGVARIAGHVRRHPVVLEMLGGNVWWVIHVEAFSIRDHGVARNAELCLFGALHVSVHPSHNAQSRKNAQTDEGHDFPSRAGCQGGTKQEDGGQYNS
jgi:hypothetical protein